VTATDEHSEVASWSATKIKHEERRLSIDMEY